MLAALFGHPQSRTRISRIEGLKPAPLWWLHPPDKQIDQLLARH
jgi:hypothetical protein